MKNRYFIIALSIIPLFAVAEEDGMNRSVTVERSYNPTTIDAVKISPVPTKEDVNVEKPEVTYSTWSTVEDVEIKNDVAKASKYRDHFSADAKNGVAKVGLGFYWQTLAEFYYPLLKDNDYLFDIDIKHKGNFSNISLSDGTTPRAMEHNSALALGFEKDFKRCKISTGANVSYNGFDYYGMIGLKEQHLQDSLQSRYGDYTTVGVNFGVNSIDVRSKFDYDFSVGYNYFGRNFGIAEHNILAELDLGGEVGPGKLGAEVEINANIMTETNPGEEKMPSGCFFKITPYYAFGGKNWDLKIGGNLFIMAEKDTKRPVTGSADIEGTFALVPELLYLNAGVGGSFNENMYSHILKENKWVSPSLFVEPTYTPVDVNLGLKANLMKGLLFEAGASYAYILDQYYFVNDTLSDGSFSNTFHAVYDNTHKVCAELGLYFTYVKNLDISVKGKYNFWGISKLEKPWQRPAWEVNFDASYLIKDKWRIGISYNFLGERYALVNGKAERMNDIHDLNLRFAYIPFNWFEVYATGNNLINIKADSYYGYTCMGINGTIGAIFRF